MFFQGLCECFSSTFQGRTFQDSPVYSSTFQACRNPVYRYHRERTCLRVSHQVVLTPACSTQRLARMVEICRKQVHMGIAARKPVFLVFDKASFKSPQLQRLAKKWNFTCSKITYDSFQKVNNKGTDQTAGMCRLACVVHKPPKTGFLAPRPIL